MVAPVYDLHIGNKNYSSWSCRAWVLMTQLGIPFREHLTPFQADGNHGFRAFSPSGRVPCLVDGDTVVWDSLAITEYLAERHPGVWPADAAARAWARCVAAEMHSGFTALRERCSMNVGVRVELRETPPALRADLARIAELWNDGLRRHGGPLLCGASFTAADAFYAPVAYRIQTYGLVVDDTAAAYARRLLGLPALQRFTEAALAETWRDPPHDEDIARAGKIVEDHRAVAAS